MPPLDLTSDLTSPPQARYDGESQDNQAGSSLEASIDKMEHIFYSNMKQTKLPLKCKLLLLQHVGGGDVLNMSAYCWVITERAKRA